MVTLVFMIIAYLLGSISTSIIISKIFHQTDPRETGSGNAGATNVLRSQGRSAAIRVLVGDLLKGFIAIVLARLFHVQGFALGLVALAAVAGHVFPVFFKFKGGKGVATSLGCILAMAFWLGVLGAVIFIVVAYFSRYASLASLIMLAAITILCLFMGHAAYFIPLLLITLFVAWKHSDNIIRLRNGTENKIYFK